MSDYNCNKTKQNSAQIQKVIFSLTFYKNLDIRTCRCGTELLNTYYPDLRDECVDYIFNHIIVCQQYAFKIISSRQDIIITCNKNDELITENIRKTRIQKVENEKQIVDQLDKISKVVIEDKTKVIDQKAKQCIFDIKMLCNEIGDTTSNKILEIIKKYETKKEPNTLDDNITEKLSKIVILNDYIN